VKYSVVAETPAPESAEVALRARYRSAARPVPGPWNATLATIVGHRSVRAFRPQPVPDGTLERLVAAAQSAPSSSNLQAWSVVAVTDAERKARLAALAGAQRHVAECPLFLVWLADLSRLRRVGELRGSATAGLEYLEAFLVAVIDAALAAQNAVIAAESLGLGAVYIGAMRNRPEQVAAELRLPPQAFAVFGLCIGLPDPAVPTEVKPRLPQEVVLHREQYGALVGSQPLDAYDADLAAFQAEQAMRPVGWTQAAAARVRAPEALSGRDRMREALESLGFALR
jgi:nitroreductase